MKLWEIRELVELANEQRQKGKPKPGGANEMAAMAAAMAAQKG